MSQRQNSILTPILSIRQPWPYCIVTPDHPPSKRKPIENRTWQTKYRGPLFIHAGSQLDSPYDEIREFARRRGIILPKRRDSTFQRGGIVGIANLVNCVSRHASPWFFGPYGFVLRDARPLPFFPISGRLGFFRDEVVDRHFAEHLAEMRRQFAAHLAEPPNV